MPIDLGEDITSLKPLYYGVKIAFMQHTPLCNSCQFNALSKNKSFMSIYDKREKILCNNFLIYRKKKMKV